MNGVVGAQTTNFGDLLKRLRKRAGLTQDDLAAALGYSRALIGALERNERLPDVTAVMTAYVPALALQDEPGLAAQLLELAAAARGQRPPSLPLTFEEPAAPDPGYDYEDYRLPALPVSLIGRDTELEDVCDRLLNHSGRLITLIGPPGVGKTTLAIAVGRAMQKVFRDGVRFVPLAALTDPGLLASTLAAALELRDATARTPEDRLIAHLRRKQILLILDNFEQLISPESPAVELVSTLLAECGQVRMLLTSRERLHLRAEQRYRVPPLAVDAAVKLFVDRSAAVDASFTLTAANRPTIEAICDQVDRLPLALELCAAQTDLLSLPQLLAHLQSERLGQLVDGNSDLPPRQRTLRDAIRHSYALLDPEERALLRCLGIFSGGCSLEAVAAVSGWGRQPAGRDLLSTLHGLIGKSLVRAETTAAGDMRFLLLETIREYALEQVRSEGEEYLLRERHFAFFLQFFREADDGLRGSDSLTWWSRVELEQDNLRAGLQWTFDSGRYEDAAWLILAAVGMWFYSGRWHEAGWWIARLLPFRDRFGTDLRLALMTQIYSVGRGYEELQPLQQFNDELIELIEASRDTLLQAAGWYIIAYMETGIAAALRERSIALIRRAYAEPDPAPGFGWLHDRDAMLAGQLRWYADRLIELGEFALGEALLGESTELYEKRGSPIFLGDALGSHGRSALFQGDVARAYPLLQNAVTAAKTYRYQEVVGFLEPLLGYVTLHNGDVAGARQLLDKSLRHCLDLHDKVFVARICAFMAAVELCDGEADEAERWLMQSHLFDPHPLWISIGELERLYLSGRVAVERGLYDRAATLFGAADEARGRICYKLVPPAQELVDAAGERARLGLGTASYDAAYLAGSQLQAWDAFALVPGVLPATGMPARWPQG